MPFVNAFLFKNFVILLESWTILKIYGVDLLKDKNDRKLSKVAPNQGIIFYTLTKN